MANLAALATSLVTLLIASALAAVVWALTGSIYLGGGALLIALNPVWLLVTIVLAPQLVRTR